jgi:hypothetical protein
LFSSASPDEVLIDAPGAIIVIRRQASRYRNQQLRVLNSKKIERVLNKPLRVPACAYPHC